MFVVSDKAVKAADRKAEDLVDRTLVQFASKPDIQTIRRSYQNALERMITEGLASGEFDCDDAHLATLAVLGLVNSVNDWFRVTGRYTIEQVAASYADIAVGRILGAR